MDLSTMHSRIETDLKDVGNTRFADAEIDRAIQRAVDRYSEANPLLAYVDLTMDASRWFDISGQTGYLWCEAVEYPIDNDLGRDAACSVSTGTPTYRTFREDRLNKKVYVQGRLPVVGDQLRFWYAKVHTLDNSPGGGSTIPLEHEDVIALGAGALCVQMQAEYAIDRLSPSALASAQYQTWAEKRLAEFQAKLQAIKDARLTSIGGVVISWGAARV